MSVQGPNAVARSHSNAASACQTSVPPGAKNPSIGLLNELWGVAVSGGPNKEALEVRAGVGRERCRAGRQGEDLEQPNRRHFSRFRRLRASASATRLA